MAGLALPAILAAVLAAGCIPPYARRPSSPPPAVERTGYPDIEEEVYQRVNTYRAGRQLVRLGYDARLAVLAREHSENMAAHHVPFSHDGFEDRTRRIASFIDYRRVAENLHWNDYEAGSTARVAVTGWLQSPGHLANIAGPFDVTGVGVARGDDGRFYFTQLFVDAP